MKLRFPLFEEAGDGSGGGGGGVTILGGGGGGQGDGQQHQQQQQPQPFDFRSALADDGSFKQDWTSSLPDDLKDYAPTLGKYPNAKELLRGLGNAQKLIGQRPGVKPPGPDAKPEEVAAWRKALGIPDAPDGYQIAKPEKLPEGVNWSDDDAKAFTAKAHEIGLTPAQVTALTEFDIQRQAAGTTKGKGEIEAYIAKQREELKASWGGDYENNLARAAKTAEFLGIDPKDPELGNSPKMIQALYKASQLIKEDAFVSPDKTGTGMTGQEQADDILHNKNNPLHNALWGREGTERQRLAQETRARLLGYKGSLDVTVV
jgi:hypothetical protein